MSRILCVGQDKEKLEKVKALAKKVLPFADVEILTNEQDIFYEVDRKDFLAVLSETQEKDFDGLKIARKIHEISSQTKVIFITEKPEFAVPAFKTRAVGYLLGEISEKSLKEEFDDLGIGMDSVINHDLVAKTFGNFELLCDGKAVKFSRAKSKELIAFLIDKRGTSASASELIVNLWEDRDVDKTTRSMLQNLIADIRNSFRKCGISDFLDTKRNSFRIDDSKVVCDLYQMLNGDETACKNFVGEYMNSYSWAEETAGLLFRKVNGHGKNDEW